MGAALPQRYVQMRSGAPQALWRSGAPPTLQRTTAQRFRAVPVLPPRRRPPLCGHMLCPDTALCYAPMPLDATLCCAPTHPSACTPARSCAVALPQPALRVCPRPRLRPLRIPRQSRG